MRTSCSWLSGCLFAFRAAIIEATMAPALVPATLLDRVPGSIEFEYGADQPDPFHAAPFEDQVYRFGLGGRGGAVVLSSMGVTVMAMTPFRSVGPGSRALLAGDDLDRQ